ncbi:VanZ family protein [Pseudorhodoferax sp. Leaf267]|uniref:VanZ family protein n=1 Tax=Pseudorhodoferax sp. Leaf267 TaxID=1736316 RepID=UPI000716226A|nr:VanZ family protein [Pseudorhodoferax sp. Leaf267]KQP23512.1 hypothetical protein ASF43_06590 [Pseudorhodoferax sp. Leaf267]
MSNPAARPAAAAAPAERRLFALRTAIAILLVAIAYGSLYPFAWNFDAPQAFVVSGRVGRTDLVENIVLFLPLGCVLAWYFDARGRMRAGFLAWFVLALVFASVLQWLQIYLPRIPAAADIVFNMVGHVLGWGVGMLTARGVQRLLQAHARFEAVHRLALALVGLWIVAELFPLVPTLDRSTLAANLKSLWQQDLWQPRRLLLHLGMTVIGLHALAWAVHSLGWQRHLRRAAVAATLAVLMGKFVVIWQSPGLAVVLGIAAGPLLWGRIARAPERQAWLLMMGVAGCTYLVYALAPYRLMAEPTPMHWVPFTSSLENGIHRVLPTVAFECLVYGAMLWSAARLGASARASVVLLAVLVLACEYLQRYLPGRTAEISSVLWVAGMGWLVAVLEPQHLRRGPPV